MGKRGFAKDDFESSSSVSLLFVGSETAIGRPLVSSHLCYSQCLLEQGSQDASIRPLSWPPMDVIKLEISGPEGPRWFGRPMRPPHHHV